LQSRFNQSQDAGAKAIEDLDKLRFASGNTKTSALRLEMQMVMQNHAAVYRAKDTLDEGVVKIDGKKGKQIMKYLGMIRNG